MKFRHISIRLRRKLIGLPRKKHHPIIHHIHRKHRISRRTLFYMKEYGPRSHLIHEVIKDSTPVLLLSVILTSLAGFALRSILDKLAFLIPIVIMIPALNDMIGDRGSVIASKFTTGLFLGKVKGDIWKSSFTRHLLYTNIKVALLSVMYLSLLALFFSAVKGFRPDLIFSLKIVFIGLVSSMIIVTVLFLVSVIGGTRIFKKEEDPNNFLVPMSTSIADAVTLVIVSLFAILLF